MGAFRGGKSGEGLDYRLRSAISGHIKICKEKGTHCQKGEALTCGRCAGSCGA